MRKYYIGTWNNTCGWRNVITWKHLCPTNGRHTYVCVCPHDVHFHAGAEMSTCSTIHTPSQLLNTCSDWPLAQSLWEPSKEEETVPTSRVSKVKMIIEHVLSSYKRVGRVRLHLNPVLTEPILWTDQIFKPPRHSSQLENTVQSICHTEVLLCSDSFFTCRCRSMRMFCLHAKISGFLVCGFQN